MRTRVTWTGVTAMLLACGGSGDSTSGSPTAPPAKGSDPTLFIIVGPGVTGTPSSSAAAQLRGSSVAYSFAPDAAHQNLTVALDGVSVPRSGTVRMDTTHVLLAGADAITQLQPKDSIWVRQARDLLAAPDPISALQAIVTQSSALIASAGEDSLARLLTAVSASSSPSQSDTATIRRVNRALNGQVIGFGLAQGINPSAVRGSLAGMRLDPRATRAPAMRLSTARATASAQGGNALAGSPVTIVYVNGIQNHVDDALGGLAALTKVVQEAGFDIQPTGTYRARLIFNATWADQSEDPVGVCLAQLQDRFATGNWRQFSDLVAQCDPSDITAATQQLLDLLGRSAGPEAALAQRVAAFAQGQLDAGRSVLLVGHSQGTLITQQAISLLAGNKTDATALPNACLGDIEIAAPIGYIGPPLAARSGVAIYAGELGQDIILRVGRNILDKRIATPTAVYDEVFLQSLNSASGFGSTFNHAEAAWVAIGEQIALHSLVDSYLHEVNTRESIRNQFAAAIPALAASCAAAAGSIASVTVSPSSPSITIGGTVSLIATDYNAGGSQLTGRPVGWATNNPSVATVSAAGVVTGKAPGSAVVTATSGGKQGTSSVTVAAPAAVVSVTVSPRNVAVVVGATLTLTATTFDANQQPLLGQPVMWNSSDTRIATVTPAGTVTGVALGTVTITVSAGSASTIATVTVSAVPSISSSISTIAPNNYHTCALNASGHAYCWGDGIYGILGNGAATTSYVPVAVAGGATFTSIVTGFAHSCALSASGAVSCWGSNGDGELGTGTTANSNVPTPVAGNIVVAALVGGSSHTCGLVADGTAYCWGFNRIGQSGIGSQTEAVPTPTAVATSLKFASLAAGELHSCGLTQSGVAYCWGDNTGLQLGTVVSTTCTLTTGNWPCAVKPVAVNTTLRFTTITAGGSHTCGLTESGAAYCWGSTQGTYVGQTFGLGDGTENNSATPVRVASGLTFTALAAGREYTCGLVAGGQAYCWGDNRNGQLGNVGSNQLVPTQSAVGLRLGRIAAGWNTTCGRLASDATVYCWGSGPLGDGSTAQFSGVPARVQVP